LLRWLFYIIESQTQCQKNLKAEEIFKILMISVFNQATYLQRRCEVGKNSRFSKRVMFCRKARGCTI